MTTFSAILGGVVAVLQSHLLCERVAIAETKEFSADQFFFKVRVELRLGYQFQARIYYNYGHVDYAYQLFKEGIPVLRWDNKEEFRSLKTYPHHHHEDRGKVLPSPLMGNPQEDIAPVLGEIEKYLEK